ncbi:D-cysteine desulfhydrase family protein [Roseibium sp. SCP14]|uniref:D-cysteine desulfhydrase family protein n=1 Tax=Roseibium sp. SCP14 TaxID=3141375 RepID=UPI0033373EE5
MLSNRLADIDLLPELDRHPRVDLGLIRSNLDPLERLGRELGITLYAKRDDAQPLAMGGNKTRQLEFYLGLAAEQDSDTVLITGAVQSNFVRSCAAAARKLGWHAIVQLEDRVPKNDPIYASSGNVLLDRLLGAEIHYFPEGENEAAADANLDRMAEECARRGKKPYVIHLGADSPPIGGLGYAYAAAETWRQFRELGVIPDHVVIPSGSGLTHAGFLVGARAIGWEVPVHGICVRRAAELQVPRIARRAEELNAMLENRANLTQRDILVDDTTLAPGYGRMNEAVFSAISRTAQDEALLLDPVYSGRTMAGLISLVERGVIATGSTVAFIHTGGLPAIFAYQNDLAPAPGEAVRAHSGGAAAI